MRKNEDFRKNYIISNILSEGRYINIYKAKTKENNENRAIKVVDKNKIKNALINLNPRQPNNNEMKEYINGLIKEIEKLKTAQGKIKIMKM